MICMKSSFGGKRFFGSVLVGRRGQAVIPEEARKQYGIKAGDRLLVFGGSREVIVLVKAEFLKEFTERLLKSIAVADKE
jgi:AbrB family looped-hinge helix DNA binding protein